MTLAHEVTIIIPWCLRWPRPAVPAYLCVLLDMKNWCRENVGEQGEDWLYRPLARSIIHKAHFFGFSFERAEDAVHFALRWKGET